MRPLIFASLVLIASTASAQNMFQMNAAYQNQFNNAYRSASPYYGGGYYAPYYAPARVAPVARLYRPGGPIRATQRSFYQSDRLFAEQLEIQELRNINSSLNDIEFQMRMNAIWDR